MLTHQGFSFVYVLDHGLIMLSFPCGTSFLLLFALRRTFIAYLISNPARSINAIIRLSGLFDHNVRQIP
jgi:hypothetical protein